MLIAGFGLWTILVWLGGLLLIVLIDVIRESCRNRQPDWESLSQALAEKPAGETKLSPAYDLFGSPAFEERLSESVPETVPAVAMQWSRRGSRSRRARSAAPAGTC